MSKCIVPTVKILIHTINFVVHLVVTYHMTCYKSMVIVKIARSKEYSKLNLLFLDSSHLTAFM